MTTDQPRPSAPDHTQRPADAPNRFVEDGVGLIWGGSQHLPDDAPGREVFGPCRYARLVYGWGQERKLSTLIRWDTGKMAFAKWRAGHGGQPGTWVDDSTLVDYFVGDDRSRAMEVDVTAAFAYLAVHP